MFRFFVIFAAFAVLTSTAVHGLTDQQKSEAASYIQACSKEVGLDPKKAAALWSGNTSEVDSKIQCFTKCYMEKSGALKNGAFDAKIAVDKLSTNVDKNVAEGITKKCSGLKGTNDCETSFKIFKCFIENKDALKL